MRSVRRRDVLQQLRDRVAALESFSRSVAHDLRGPLQGIAGMATLATASLQQGDLDFLRRALPAIERQAERSVRLAEALLLLARIGRAEPSATSVDMGGLVRELWEQLALSDPRMSRTRLVVSNDLGTVTTDDGLLRVALMNLLSNAVKFSAGRDGACVQIGGRRLACGVEITVRDNGPGFDPAHATVIFEPFIRLHGSGHEGHGIGLSIVRQAVERLGGKVWATSQPGAGAVFCVLLPVDRAAQPPVRSFRQGAWKLPTDNRREGA